MPDQPPHPNFDFFTERDERDTGDENQNVQYPHEPERFTRAGEVERLTAQLEQLRAEFRRIYPPLPVFMQERLEGLRVLLGVER